MNLADARTKIDAIDSQIIEKLIERDQIIQKIAKIKAKEGVNVIDETREQKVIEKLTLKSQGIFSKTFIAALYSVIFAYFRNKQKKILK